MSTSLHPMLMFTGQAEEAMKLYTSLFEDGEILTLQRYGPEAPDREGTVMHATFRIAGQRIACIDSPPVHPFSFTPSTSLWVACDRPEEVDRLFAALSKDGAVMMALNAYPFSPRYAWINDRFGVSWQLAANP